MLNLPYSQGALRCKKSKQGHLLVSRHIIGQFGVAKVPLGHNGVGVFTVEISIAPLFDELVLCKCLCHKFCPARSCETEFNQLINQIYHSNQLANQPTVSIT